MSEVRPLHALAGLAMWNARGFVLVGLRRLRRPWTLVPMVLGGAFFVYALAIVLAGVQWAHPGGLSGVGGALVLWAVGGAWMAAAARPGTGLSPAEAQILGAAPLRPRHLVAWRVLRAQPGLLAAAAAVGVAAGDARLPHLGAFFGMFVLMETLLVHQVAASLTVGRLAMAGAPRWAQLLPPVLVITTLAAVIGGSVTPVPGLEQGARVMIGWADEMWTLEPAATALSPLRALVLLPLSPDWAVFAQRLPAALGVFGVVVGWLWSVAGALPEEASSEEVPDEADAGGGPIPRSWPVPALGATGPAWRALAWRSIVELLRRASPRAVLAVLGVHLAAGGAWWLSQGMGAARDPAATLTGLVLAVILLGPTLVRIDLRADVDRYDTLRQFPIAGHDVVRGTGAGALLGCMLIELVMLAAAGAASTNFVGAGRLLAVLAGGIGAFGATALAFALAAWMSLAWPLFERRPGGPGGIEAVGALVAGTAVRNVLLWFALIPAWIGMAVGVAASRRLAEWVGDVPVGVVLQGAGFGIVALIVAELVIRRAGRRLELLD